MVKRMRLAPLFEQTIAFGARRRLQRSRDWRCGMKNGVRDMLARAEAGDHPRFVGRPLAQPVIDRRGTRSEEHTSELQSLMRISYAVFCLTKKNKKQDINRVPIGNLVNSYTHTN